MSNQDDNNNANLQCGSDKNCALLEEEQVIDIAKPELKMLMMGCWGVYGGDGESEFGKVSYKDGKLVHKTERVVFGAQTVGAGMARQGPVDAVILAGDNVYPKSVIRSEAEAIDAEFTKYKSNQDKDLAFDKVKAELHDFMKQYNDGFLKIIKKVDSQRFFVAIGNHDAKSCLNLSREMDPALQSDGWLFPALSYTQLFRLNDGTEVNLIFIDTNVYDFDENEVAVLCSEYTTVNGADSAELKRTDYGYTSTFRKTQMEWVNSVVREHAWNILIGHIPPVMAPHKPTMDMFNRNLYDDLAALTRSASGKIHLYLCADEHNQQFIADPLLPPVAIVGSGGNHLDPIVSERLKKSKDKVLYYAKSIHGFASLLVSQTSLDIVFHQTPVNKSPTTGCTIRITKELGSRPTILSNNGNINCEVE